MSEDFGIVVPFEPYDRDVWSGRLIDFDAYRYSIQAFGINKMRVINLTSMELPGKDRMDQALDYKVYSSYAEFFADEAGPYVAFETEWSYPKNVKPIPLNNLTHFNKGWYVFGPSEGFKPFPADLMDVEWSYLPVKPRIAWHTTHVVAAVMWDRELWLKHMV